MAASGHGARPVAPVCVCLCSLLAWAMAFTPSVATLFRSLRSRVCVCMRAYRLSPFAARVASVLTASATLRCMCESEFLHCVCPSLPQLSVVYVCLVCLSWVVSVFIEHYNNTYCCTPYGIPFLSFLLSLWMCASLSLTSVVCLRVSMVCVCV